MAKKVEKTETVQVEVLQDWGVYKKGDKIKMHSTTAKACEKHEKVKII